jgi:hypothetical protein
MYRLSTKTYPKNVWLLPLQLSLTVYRYRLRYLYLGDKATSESLVGKNSIFHLGVHCRQLRIPVGFFNAKYSDTVWIGFVSMSFLYAKLHLCAFATVLGQPIVSVIKSLSHGAVVAFIFSPLVFFSDVITVSTFFFGLFQFKLFSKPDS